MTLTLSGREIGLIYTLLRNANDSLLKASPAESGATDDGDNAFPRTARLHKLIASNLRHKLQSELVEKS